MRLSVLITHPIQYFAPVFRGLSEAEGVELKVFFGSDHGAREGLDENFQAAFRWDSNLTEGYNHEFLSNRPLSALSGLSGTMNAFRAVKKISGFSPDAVLIFSYSPVFITVASGLLALKKKPMLLRAETTDLAISRPWWKEVLRKRFLSAYYRIFDYVLPIGANSILHYSRHGVDASRQITALYSIDYHYFQEQISSFFPKRRSLRAEFSIPEDAHVILFCGKMFAPKNPLLIPDALQLLPPEKLKGVWLIAVGDGVLREQFQRGVAAVLGNRSVFTGFQNQSALGKFYSMADTLVLPSRSGETWGLVVNEALQFGLRVIASDKVGSIADLIKSEEDGWVFKSGDALGLSHCIAEAISVPRGRPRINLPRPDMMVGAVLEALKRIGHVPR